MTAYLDTHVAVWLHDGLVERLSAEAARQIEANDLLLSPMVVVELEYLRARKRIRTKPVEMITYLAATFGIGVCGLPFPAVALSSLGISWTSDPFDRLIVAQAAANHNAMLISADTLIRAHYRRAVW